MPAESGKEVFKKALSMVLDRSLLGGNVVA